MGAVPRMACTSSAGPFLGTFLGKQKGTRKKEDVLISKLFVSYSLINFWSGPLLLYHYESLNQFFVLAFAILTKRSSGYY